MIKSTVTLAGSKALGRKVALRRGFHSGLERELDLIQVLESWEGI